MLGREGRGDLLEHKAKIRGRSHLSLSPRGGEGLNEANDDEERQERRPERRGKPPHGDQAVVGRREGMGEPASSCCQPRSRLSSRP